MERLLDKSNYTTFDLLIRKENDNIEKITVDLMYLYIDPKEHYTFISSEGFIYYFHNTAISLYRDITCIVINTLTGEKIKFNLPIENNRNLFGKLAESIHIKYNKCTPIEIQYQLFEDFQLGETKKEKIMLLPLLTESVHLLQNNESFLFKETGSNSRHRFLFIHKTETNNRLDKIDVSVYINGISKTALIDKNDYHLLINTFRNNLIDYIK